MTNRGHNLICPEPEFVNKSPFRPKGSDPSQNSEPTQNVGLADIFMTGVVNLRASAGHILVGPEPEFINKCPFRRNDSDLKPNSESTQNLELNDTFLDVID